NANSSWFDTSAFSRAGLTCNTTAVAAGAGTYGTAPRNLLRGPGRFNTDVALQKSTPIKGERLNLVLRGEFFNVVNNVQFLDPSPNIGDTKNCGRISTTSPARTGQLAVRLTF